MSDSVESFLKELPGKPFAVQFVLSVTVEGHDEPLTQVKTYLLAASSIEDARSTAQKFVGLFADAYNNSKGELVTTECLGIHRILEPNYVADGRWLGLGTFTYSASTRPDHLVNEPKNRTDIPRLGQR
jgi:hypothetical protein